MTRTEYLAKLDRYLHRLPEKDYQEAMDYFTEYFDEAGPENEAQVMTELGTPKEAAQDLLEQLWDKQEDREPSRSRFKGLRLALLTLIVAPLSLLAILVAVPLVIVFLATILAFVVSALASLLGGVAVLAVFIWESMTLPGLTPAAMAMGIGAGLLIMGLMLLLYLIFIGLSKVLTRFLIAIIRRLTRRKGARA
ncbi:DUF1700 domain-containing protein [Streptococcus hyovaginalis]|uniref:DUF1700 domain-containing protein n=1 Tax=Streptococcus hyovaginalis TaxID=149015 RepID=UPI002A9140A0|nr:DUF1700 domain-containing protein [Streptococcus hyovaginalis]MDY5974958.1 DUF1700 domain-containing protein [Streptococcus hyovaginalis]